MNDVTSKEKRDCERLQYHFNEIALKLIGSLESEQILRARIVELEGMLLSYYKEHETITKP